MEKTDQNIMSKVRKVFKKQPLRIWYVISPNDNCKAVILNTLTKTIVFETKVFACPAFAKQALFKQIENMYARLPRPARTK